MYNIGTEIVGELEEALDDFPQGTIGILVTDKPDWFTDDAKEAAKSSRKIIILTDKDHLVEEMSKYLPSQLQQNLAVVKTPELQVQFEAQQQRIEAVELQQKKIFFLLYVLCFFVFCFFCCLLYVIFLLRQK